MSQEQDTGAPVSIAAHTDCEFWGVGGQYVVDPVTGKRERVGGLPLPPKADEATQGAEQSAAVAEVQAATEAPASSSKKEGKRA